jgi:hypothetical protein
MLTLAVVYDHGQMSELVKIPAKRRLQDLRDYFKSPKSGKPATSVEILEYSPIEE